MITISIVTYKTDLKELAKCLVSLTSHLVSTIYVVDNSRMKVIEEFCNKYSNVVYIGSENVGYGTGHNKALRCAIKVGVKYHLVLNSDVYFDPNILDKIVEYMDDHEDVGQLIPNTVYPDGRLQYVCRLLPTPLNLILRRFLPKRFSDKLDTSFLLKEYKRINAIDAPFLLGSFMFFRVKYLNCIGLFDERIFMYMEDIDITRRMHKYFKTIFWPGVTIVHAHKAASYKNNKMLKIHMKSAIQYFNKWGWFFDKERSRWNKQVLAAASRDAELITSKYSNMKDCFQIKS